MLLSGITEDQRGFPRVVDGDQSGSAELDIGAFEAPPLPLIVDTLVDENDGIGVNGTSLREAITAANAGVSDRIEFSVAGTIAVTSGLPDITVPLVVIDGSSAPGFVSGGLPVIGIDGTNAGNSSGLTFRSDGFGADAFGGLVFGLGVRNFQQVGIDIFGANGINIQGCNIGTELDGNTAAGNGVGIRMESGGMTGAEASDSVIGGVAPGLGNIIAYSTTIGIEVIGDTDFANFVQRNTFRGNMVFGNVVSGITVSNPANGNVAPPTIDTFTGTGASGTGVQNATIDLYYDRELNSVCQGDTYVGSVTVGAVSPTWTFNGCSRFRPPPRCDPDDARWQHFGIRLPGEHCAPAHHRHNDGR